MTTDCFNRSITFRRPGKYIKLQYDADFRLVGARTEHFLLEKSRLVHLEDSERSYHILYQVYGARRRRPRPTNRNNISTFPQNCIKQFCGTKTRTFVATTSDDDRAEPLLSADIPAVW